MDKTLQKGYKKSNIEQKTFKIDNLVHKNSFLHCLMFSACIINDFVENYPYSVTISVKKLEGEFHYV